MLTGLTGILIYYSAKIIKQIVNKQNDRLILVLEALIILITPILFSKYYYHFFGDYFGLIIIPFFIFSAIIFLFKKKGKHFKLTLTTILYLIMTIPLFGLDYYKSPTGYVPQSCYDRYDVEEAIPISLPYEFKNSDAEELCEKAFELKKSKEYYQAIFLYRKAIKIEPNNPELYFDISECYANTNNLEKAISAIDTAILIDSDMHVFYNNRGMLYYKLKENGKALQDYEMAIKLDSTQHIYYTNLALVYFYMEEYEKANQALDIAESLGGNISKNRILRRIRKKNK